jgi:hypothetical protein
MFTAGIIKARARSRRSNFTVVRRIEGTYESLLSDEHLKGHKKSEEGIALGGLKS